MTPLLKGQRLPLANILSDNRCQIDMTVTGHAVDFSCFALDAADKLVDESYMTFFNQPASPCGGVRFSQLNAVSSFNFNLNVLPATIHRLVIAMSIDGQGNMQAIQSGSVVLKDHASYAFSKADFENEKAVMLAELYRKDGQWRLMIVGQGFNGGLDALVQHFGGEVAAAEPVTASNNATNEQRISLEKRVEKEAPQLVSLVKKAAISLEKVGLGSHKAKVCLVLDISGSMNGLYKSGAVQKFAEKILALGCRFDDDGEIDVFLFGKNVHQPAAMGLQNCQAFVQQAIHTYPLEGDTRYGLAMEAVRKFYAPANNGQAASQVSPAKIPVYVMFVTDGSTSDQAFTEKQLKWASYEPIFWQFMGIGKGRKSKSKKLLSFASSDFPFLEKLDELQGRCIDNASYFSVAAPDELNDEELYDLLMDEYPQWIKLAKNSGILI